MENPTKEVPRAQSLLFQRPQLNQEIEVGAEPLKCCLQLPAGNPEGYCAPHVDALELSYMCNMEHFLMLLMSPPQHLGVYLVGILCPKLPCQSNKWLHTHHELISPYFY